MTDLGDFPFLQLKEGREDPVLRRHPWIFSGAVQRTAGDPAAGETIRILSSHGAFLAWGSYSPDSQIRARIWSWEQEERVGESLFRDRLQRCIRDRRFLDLPGNARRLVHGESDGLPGLILDQYEQTLVIQYLSAGAEHWRHVITDLLVELLEPESVYERSDAEVRDLEGLQPRTGLVYGGPLPENLIIREAGRMYRVDPVRGHKTGFYLDQRDNRTLVETLARERRVLDCFCYTGGFSTAALKGGAAELRGVDSSEDALRGARKNLELNGLPDQKAEFITGDVFQVLRNQRDRGERYDLVILDPPKFAPTSSHAGRAARGYKDINLWAMKLIQPGGLLVTFSCSGGVDRAFFQKILADAAVDAGVQARIIKELRQAPDHPVNLSFPEGSYLKGFVLRVN